MNSVHPVDHPPLTTTLAQRFCCIRAQSLTLALPLSEADMTIQGAEFASPGKWHLAHTTWFFETFFLSAFNGYLPYSADYTFLFNSYYETIGARQQQGLRGLITRPGLAEVMDYRYAVDAAVVEKLVAGISAELAAIIELGLQHEQQHQELFLTDILYNLSLNPLLPAAYPARPAKAAQATVTAAASMVTYTGGLLEIGHGGDGFGFDNESPRHKHYCAPYRLSSHLVNNADWLAFIEDGGYKNPLLWLADGWKTLHTEGWQSPLYWLNRDDHQQFTLYGLQALDRQAPVAHISYFEAEAYARWIGKRLPTEAEWELAANPQMVSIRFAEADLYRPIGVDSKDSTALKQLYGEVWQWTASPYTPYPGFCATAGAIGEYNGKFMNGQYVLRGGSCATPHSHMRSSYRNFFYPHQRWQFSGLRLAEDI